MRRIVGVLLGIGLMLTGLIGPAAAQDSRSSPDTTRSWREDAWTPIVERKGVGISYIFYPEADSEHNGVVLRLQNHNEVPVRYGFTVIFRAPDAERSATVEGWLAPGEMKTGNKDGLFWIPFREEDHSIGEVGLRGLEILPLEKSQREGVDHPSQG